MLRFLSLVLSAAFLGPVLAAAQQPTPGTYRIRLCDTECVAADSNQAVAVAVMVILDDSSAAAEATRATLRVLRSIRRTGETAKHDNVCFRVTARTSRIGNEELFFGIQATGATRWKYDPASGCSVRVYMSPDAGYTLRWMPLGNVTNGEGWSLGSQAKITDHRNAYFTAERIGPPEIARCFA